jgi:nitroimidazol reductase NimA-like FMN-containing flavoprotein (pyridoxamine 5'-phosphate oxidase superfamily)
MMNKPKGTLEEIGELLHQQPLAVLATRGEKYPYCTLVGFAASDDLKTLFFATIRDTRKFQNIQRHPQVSMLIDSRANTSRDFKDAQALTVLGEARLEESPERPEYVRQYLEKHPYLKEFVNNPNCGFMRLDVHKYILVSRFQEVLEVTMQ